MKILLVSALALGAFACSKSEPAPTEKAAGSASAAAGLSIPATPLAGTVSGSPFALKKVSFVTAKGFGEWRISIEGATPVAATAAIRMPARVALAEGKSFETGAAPLTPGGPRPPAVSIQAGPKSTTSNNASYRVEITKWDVKPCPSDAEPSHEGGHASGKIIVKVPGEDTEIAGTFTDATVSYGQTPDWTYR